MSVDEQTRHRIHGRFEELLGPELAGAFMSYLPPVGWADVATKRDLDNLEARLEARLEALLHATIHDEVGGLRTEMHGQFRTTIFALLASNATMVGLVFVAARVG